jgi:NADP-dependent aldehyde dehydrogenase
MNSDMQPVLIDGKWRRANAAATFQADDPKSKQALPDIYPISTWADCDAALAAAATAAESLRAMPSDRIAEFLERLASRIEARREELVETAHRETALPVSPRLADLELPRTTNQLRQAAAAAREGSWALPTIDTKAQIRSCYEPIGPVCVFGPNNFPFAFGSISGGDFAAAIAAGNPVIAKANSSHPSTTRLFGEEAQAAADETHLPPGTVQLLYRTSHADGERLVADPRLGATAYTGSRAAGLALKAAADAAGKPIYLELSSVNPVVILPGAIRERPEAIAGEFTTSCLLGGGQFCTNPGLVILLADDETEAWIGKVAELFRTSAVGTLLSKGVEQSLTASLAKLTAAGASLVTGDVPGSDAGYCHANTLLRISGREFLGDPATFQTEAFGNASLLVVADNVDEACQVVERLEGSLTGCVYSDTSGTDDQDYGRVAPLLRHRAGRLLNDKMPTGVAVSPAMNHGGPYPATGHPGFTAVGIPASLRRFAMLACYDNVRPGRLPSILRDKNSAGRAWRLVDGQWTQADAG